MPEQDIFEEINEFASDSADEFFIEHAVQVNNEHRLVTAGVQFIAEQFHVPIFLSVDELRRLADEAEKRTIEMLEK